MIDTSRTIEIERSTAELLVLLMTGILLTIGSAALAFTLVPADASLARLLGLAGLVLFGLCTLLAAWELTGRSGSAITISPQGIRDTRVAAETIPWSAITDISTLYYRYRRTVGLTLEPAVANRLTLSFPLRYTRAINRAFGYEEFSISASGAKTDFATLMADITAYWQAWRGTHARHAS